MFVYFFLLLVVGCVCVLSVLGLITFVFVPAFRPTFLNFRLFVIGGFAGSLVLASVYFGVGTLVMHYLGMGYWGIRVSRIADLLLYPVVVVGAVTGGTGLVWLRTRRKQESPKSVALNKSSLVSDLVEL